SVSASPSSEAASSAEAATYLLDEAEHVLRVDGQAVECVVLGDGVRQLVRWHTAKVEDGVAVPCVTRGCRCRRSPQVRVLYQGLGRRYLLRSGAEGGRSRQRRPVLSGVQNLRHLRPLEIARQRFLDAEMAIEGAAVSAGAGPLSAHRVVGHHRPQRLQLAG